MPHLRHRGPDAAVRHVDINTCARAAWDGLVSCRLCLVDLSRSYVYIIHTTQYKKMQSREIIKRLEADGWRKVAQQGTHVQFKHPTKPGRVTVPHPKRDIPIGTLRSIEKQCGLKLGK